MGHSAYARGGWALGECARSGRKMLLRNMVADGYYPNLIVDPMWYEPKHPQESLPSVRDPVALFRPAPDRDNVSAQLNLGGAPQGGLGEEEPVPGGGFGDPGPVPGGPGSTGGGVAGAALSFGYEIGGVAFNIVPVAQNQWDMDSTVTPEPDTGVAAALFDLAYVGSPTVSEPSLRVDSTGASIEFRGPARVTSTTVPLTYDQGFSVEYAVLPTLIGSRSVTGGISRIIPSVHAHINVSASGIFELGFDNWDNPGAATDLTPCFVLFNDDAGLYDEISDRLGSHFLGEARGTTSFNTATLGDTYHLCGTLSATGVAKLYVNGALQDSFSVNMTDFIGAGVRDLSDSSRTARDLFEIGTRFLDGSHGPFTLTGEATIDDVRWYPSELTASQVAQKAALIDFT